MFQLVILAALAPGQPYFPPPDDPRARRAARERAVHRAGARARDLVERHGEPAVAALMACSPETGRKLADWAGSDSWKALPDPDALLWAISRRDHGDEVALWALRHARELADPDAFQAFLDAPLEVCLGLSPLPEAAAKARERRLSGRGPAGVLAPGPWWKDPRNLALCALGALVAGLLWKLRAARGA